MAYFRCLLCNTTVGSPSFHPICGDEEPRWEVCTCGSGAHPRRCETHPYGYELHVAALNLEFRIDALVAQGERDAKIREAAKRLVDGYDPSKDRNQSAAQVLNGITKARNDLRDLLAEAEEEEPITGASVVEDFVRYEKAVISSLRFANGVDREPANGK